MSVMLGAVIIIGLLMISLGLFALLILLTKRREQPNPQADMEAAAENHQFDHLTYKWDGRTH